MSDEAESMSVKLRIEGSVQTVGFRYFAMDAARKLGIDGWVRNRTDGSVEALASGEKKSVEAFIAACIKGPPGARVRNIDMEISAPPAQSGFHRRPSV